MVFGSVQQAQSNPGLWFNFPDFGVISLDFELAYQ